MALKKATNKLIYKHTLNVNSRLEWSKEENIKHAIEILERHHTFKDTFKENLLKLREATVNDIDIMRFASAVMLGDKKSKEMAALEKANFKLDNVEEISTTIKNRINGLRGTIESGIGQDLYRGTKLWMLNGLTTFFSNEKKYKSEEDKFNSITEGTDAKKLDYAFNLLAA